MSERRVTEKPGAVSEPAGRCIECSGASQPKPKQKSYSAFGGTAFYAEAAGSSFDCRVSSTVVTAQEIQLDGIIVTVSRVGESAIDALAGSSTISKEQLDTQFQADSISRTTSIRCSWKVRGVEFEAFYDARTWFLGFGAHRIRGVNEDTGEGLRSVSADQITLAAGLRAVDEKLIAGARARFIGRQDRFGEGNTPCEQHADAYQTLDLFAQYEVSNITTVNLNLDNVFDQTYRQHLDQYNSPGFSARVGLTMRLGAE